MGCLKQTTCGSASHAYASPAGDVGNEHAHGIFRPPQRERQVVERLQAFLSRAGCPSSKANPQELSTQTLFDNASGRSPEGPPMPPAHGPRTLHPGTCRACETQELQRSRANGLPRVRVGPPALRKTDGGMISQASRSSKDPSPIVQEWPERDCHSGSSRANPTKRSTWVKQDQRRRASSQMPK